VTVAWKKVCNPYDEGGLGIKSLLCLNEAFNLKVGWDMMHSDEDWAVIVKSRTIKNNKPINYHIFSSIWSSMKGEYGVIRENSNWHIGDGKSIRFWQDCWCGDPLEEVFNLDMNLISQYPTFLSDYSTNNRWNIPGNLLTIYPELRLLSQQVILPVEETNDQLMWKHTASGELSLKDAYSFKKHPATKKHWAKTIWCKDIPLSKSLLAWRIMYDKLPTDDNLMARGCILPSMCFLCSNSLETSFHLFFECPFAIRLWC